MNHSPTPVPAILPYADLPARYGIQFETGAARVSFLIPSPPWWTRLEVWGILVLLPLAAAPVVLGLVKPRSEVAAVVQIAVVMGLGVAGAVVSIKRSRRPVIIELTADALRLQNVRPRFSESGDRPLKLTFARAAVYDVQYVAHSGNLVVRIHGSEMLEIKPSRDPRVLTWIAQELRRALGLPT